MSAVDPSELRGHVIVCGLAGVGFRTVEQLHLAGVPVVVVDDEPDPRRVRLVASWGVPHVVGDARLGDGLFEAGLSGAVAVVCTSSSDLHTLETALRARELRPDVRVVAQLANPSVGQALRRVTGARGVLDVAQLAAPSFVEACLGSSSHPLDLDGVPFSVVEVEVGPTVGTALGPHGTFRGRFGPLAPVAVVPADGSAMAVCPGRDHPIAPGDQVAVLGTPEDLERADIASTPPGGHAAPDELARVARARRRLRAAIRGSDRGLVFALGALGVLVVTAVLVLRFNYHPSGGHGATLGWLGAAYFTVVTIATVGYGDYSFGAQPAWLELFGTLMIVVGVVLVTTSFALFTNLLVSRRIEQSLGRRRVPGMRGHVVVIGLGSVGIAVVEGLLGEGRRVVVVERDGSNRYLDRARALGVPVVIADATQGQTHDTVNLPDASAVAILTSDDLTNIETGLAVRESLGERWDTVPVVIRVFDRNLGRMMESSFGFRHVRSTSALAAPWFVGAALGLDVLGTFYVEQQPFLVARLAVAEGGGLEGLAMQDLSARTRVIALRRGGGEGALEHPPRRGTRFAPGDQAYLLGPYEELLRVLRRDQPVDPRAGGPVRPSLADPAPSP
ncbi:MAG TPA: NAD-binding protein [Acidimicrobiales bacterium]